MVKISGPITSSIWRLPDRRRILLLGDKHFSNEHDCRSDGIDVEEFIDGVASVAVHSSQVSIYLESGFNPNIAVRNIFMETMGTPSKGKGFHISDTVGRMEVYGCLGVVPSEICRKRFPFATIIPCDTRRKTSYSVAIDACRRIMTRLEKHGIIPRACPDCQNLITALDDIGTVASVKKSNRQMARANGFDRHVDMISDPKVRRIVMDIYYGIGCVPDYNKKVARLRELMGRNTPAEHRHITVAAKILDDALECILRGSTHIMDGYAMARICSDTDADTDRIVMYTGDAHTRVYEKTLARLGARCLVRGKQLSMRCSEIPLTFFAAS